MERRMKDSGIEWIGDIPVDWDIARMKSCITQRDGGAWGDEATGEQGDVICLRIADFDYSAFKFNDTPVEELTYRHYSEETIKKLSLEKNDILIEKSGGGEKTPVGRTVIFDKEYTALFANFMDRLRTADFITPKFMQYVFVTFYKNDYTRNYIKQTTGIQNLDLTAMLARENIPLPSMDEQNRIVKFLDQKSAEIDIVIAKTKATIEEYKKLKQSIITKAVTKGIHDDCEMIETEYEWIGNIPSHWKTIKVKWLLGERKERSLEGKEEPLSMSQKFGLIPTKEMDMIPNMAATFVGAKLVYVGDLVFNKLKAHLGVFAVSKYEGLVSPDYAVYYPTGVANVKYLEYLFKTPQYIAEFRKKSSGVGAGLTRLYTDDLFSIYCSLPPMEEQEEIIAYLDKKCAEMDVLIARKTALLEEMESYKKSVIYEYVTGKKEVQ